ncbi:MAG: cupin domain-containing protein [Pseudomonadota bacterium]
MTQDDLELLAAEYVLGTLDAERRREVAAELERNSDLRDRVAHWERRLETLEDRSAAITPSAGLWSKIDQALNNETQVSRMITLRADEGPWQEISEGIEKKLLNQDPAAGVESYLLRLAPGTRAPSHSHTVTEECLMLEGDFSIGELKLGPGDYHAAPPGLDHPEVSTEAGCLLYIRGEIRAA